MNGRNPVRCVGFRYWPSEHGGEGGALWLRKKRPACRHCCSKSSLENAQSTGVCSGFSAYALLNLVRGGSNGAVLGVCLFFLM